MTTDSCYPKPRYLSSSTVNLVPGPARHPDAPTRGRRARLVVGRINARHTATQRSNSHWPEGVESTTKTW